MKKDNIKIIIISLLIILLIGGIVVGVKQKIKPKEITLEKYANIEDIKFDKNKVNAYFFWRDGCEHCKTEYEYLNELNKKYNKKLNIYALNIWTDPKNEELLNKFIDVTQDESIRNGVPLLFIGDEKYFGFGLGKYEKESEEDVLKMIKRQLKKGNDYDIYKIIKENN